MVSHDIVGKRCMISSNLREIDIETTYQCNGWYGIGASGMCNDSTNKPTSCNYSFTGSGLVVQQCTIPMKKASLCTDDGNVENCCDQPVIDNWRYEGCSGSNIGWSKYRGLVDTGTNDTWENEGKYLLNTSFVINNNISIPVSSGLDIPDGDEFVHVSGIIKKASVKGPPDSIGLVIEIELEDTKCIPSIKKSTYCPLDTSDCTPENEIHLTKFSSKCTGFGKGLYEIEVDTKGLVDTFGEDEAKKAAEYLKTTFTINQTLVVDGINKGVVESIDIKKTFGTWYVVLGISGDISCKEGVSYDKTHVECLRNTDQAKSMVRCDNWPTYCEAEDADCAIAACKYGLPDGYDDVQIVQKSGYFDEIWTNDLVSTNISRCGAEYLDDDWVNIGDCKSGEQVKKRKIDLKENWDDASLIRNSFVASNPADNIYLSTKESPSDCRKNYIDGTWHTTEPDRCTASPPDLGKNYVSSEIRFKSSTAPTCQGRMVDGTWNYEGCSKSRFLKYSFLIDTNGLEPSSKINTVNEYMKGPFKDEAVVSNHTMHSYKIDDSTDNMYYIRVLLQNDGTCKEDIGGEVETSILSTKNIILGVVVLIIFILINYILSKLD
jgi:hypothetical protein